MQFGWKILIPVNLVWIMVVATIRVMQQQNTKHIYLFAFLVTLVLIVFLTLTIKDSLKVKKQKAFDEMEFPQAPFPLPKLSENKVISGGDND
jgi:NADH-quinone oxidoreductase subunit H